MNSSTLTEPASPPPYFTCDATRALDRIVEAAGAKAATAQAVFDRRNMARTTVREAEAQFVNTLTDESAAALTSAKSKLQVLEHSCAALEDHGGPDGIRHKAIHQRSTFEFLAEGLTEKIELLGAQLPKAMQALGRTRAAKTEAGVFGIAIEADPEVVRLRVLGETIVAQRRDASAARDFALRWTPASRDQAHGFSGLFGILQSPLPATL